MTSLRTRLIETALLWQARYGVAPSITSAISELDAALLVGMTEDDYSSQAQSQTAVQRGHDFVFSGIRYQVKANRPSGRPGSKVTLVPKAKSYAWDRLVWILYDREYEIQEAWLWEVDNYKSHFGSVNRLSPADYRLGISLRN